MVEPGAHLSRRLARLVPVKWSCLLVIPHLFTLMLDEETSWMSTSQRRTLSSWLTLWRKTQSGCSWWGEPQITLCSWTHHFLSLFHLWMFKCECFSVVCSPCVCLEVGSGSGVVSAFLASVVGPSALYLWVKTTKIRMARLTLPVTDARE